MEITVAEGINREVRRLFAALGHEVKKLVRIRVGPLLLKGLGKRQCRHLTSNELHKLQEAMKKSEDTKTTQNTRYYKSTTGKRGGKPDPAKAAPSKHKAKLHAAKKEDAKSKKTSYNSPKRNEKAGSTSSPSKSPVKSRKKVVKKTQPKLAHPLKQKRK